MTTEIKTDEREYKTEIETSGVVPTVKLSWPDAADNRKELFQSAFNQAYSDPNVSVMFEDEPLRLSCFGRMETGLRTKPNFPGCYGFDAREDIEMVLEQLYQQGYVKKVTTYRQLFTWEYDPAKGGHYKKFNGRWEIDKFPNYDWNEAAAEFLPDGWDEAEYDGFPWDWAKMSLKATWVKEQRTQWEREGQRQGLQLAMCSICPLFGRCAVLSGNLKGVVSEDY